MDKSLLALDGFILFVVGATIFALLWVIIYKTLKEVAFFKGRVVEATVATCVSLLSVIGMFQFLNTGDGTYNILQRTNGDGADVDMILLPYAAFAIALLLVALYLFARRFLGTEKPERFFHHAERTAEQALKLDWGKGDRRVKEKGTRRLREKKIIRGNSHSLRLMDRPRGKPLHENDSDKKTKSNRIKQ
ncbi:MAG: hypothetical protein ACYS74_02755 [Planctomycetota bacterium]